MISPADSKKATARGGNYQDDIIEPLARRQDSKSVGKFDEAESMEYILDTESGTPSGDVFAAVDKVVFI